MGDLLVDKHTKGYTELSDKSLSSKVESDISPALTKLDEFIGSVQLSTEAPLRLTISSANSPEKSIEVTVHNVNELRDILHFAIDK